jgi:hypothetical protein
MPQPDLDAIERQALAFIVEQLEAGKTHILTDTFLPFLKSIEAGDRLVAILTHFEGLGILSPEHPKQRTALPFVIPAYWRIEGAAVIQYRGLLAREREGTKSTKSDKRPRGRPADSDPRADKRIVDAWKSGQYRKHKDLAMALGMRATEVTQALDRHRKRAERNSPARRTNSPNKSCQGL